MRVGAFVSIQDNAVLFLGYGVRIEDEVPGNDVPGPFAEVLRRNKLKNVKIRLDNGDVVWGCEVWWAPEEAARTRIDELVRNGHELREVRIAEHRGNLSAVVSGGAQ